MTDRSFVALASVVNSRTSGVEHIGENAPCRETICAVVITQNPDSDLCVRLKKVSPQVAQIVVVDNGSAAPCMRQLRQLKDDGNIHLLLNLTNEGIARALNRGAQWATQHGGSWILTLDQDTVVSPDMVKALAAVYNAFPEPDRLAVIGSNYTNLENGQLAALSRYRGGPWGREAKAVITSGSLIPLRVFDEIGGFREDFFVDCVDVEYCLRARARGFCIAMTLQPVMQHSIGRLTEHHLFGRQFQTTNHSPHRRYLLARNTVILAREYMGTELKFVLETLCFRMNVLLRICLFENQRIPKIAYSLLGVLDGIRGKMNRFANLTPGPLSGHAPIK